MLDRLRKRFQNLLSSKDSSVLEEEPSSESSNLDALSEALEDVEKARVSTTKDVETVLLARREAQKRESRLILSERVHNRAAVLLNELRTELLNVIHGRLAEEVQDKSLHNLLQVTLDMAFTTRLDGTIDEWVEKLFDKLRAEFKDEGEAGQLMPDKTDFVSRLQSYRDEILRKHLLEQVEVLALPTSTQAFPEEDKGSPGELKARIAQYWSSCREALDKFFRSVEMVLLDGAREGIRLESSLIRERLVAAQYRNGYRLLDERFRHIYGEVAQLQMSAEPTEQARGNLDRRVVDEIIVPLAYFIRERSEPEPREALVSRAELFGEIVDKLVAVPEPFHQTAEAVKPVLRKSVEQTRPLAIQDFPFLRSVIESLNPAAIHRTTALLRVFETLVKPELDEKALHAIEQTIRLNRAQYRLFQQLERSYPELISLLDPLDRIDDEDAALLSELVEHDEPPPQMMEDLFLSLGYVKWPSPIPEDTRTLLRLLAVLSVPARDFSAHRSLYSEEGPTPDERERLARSLVAALDKGSVGVDERVGRVGAVPLPIDLGRALSSMGYRPDDKDRFTAFKEDMRRAIRDGGPDELADALGRIRVLQQAVEQERIRIGATGIEADPYVVEIWLADTGKMVGLVLYRGSGFGTAPVEVLARDPSGGNRRETEEKLRRQLQNQAIIYQAFHKLFSEGPLLTKERRLSLPTFVKKLYEPTDAGRHLLLARLRYASELIARLNTFAKLIVEADSNKTADAKAVVQILGGLDRKVNELTEATERSRAQADLTRLVKEYERALKYLNIVVVHAINPWLIRQTAELATEFHFDKSEVEQAVREYAGRRGIHWEEDVEGFEAHGIRGTMGCRALVKLADGSSKVVLLSYQRRRREWHVRHMGPRLTDVVRMALRDKGKTLPETYDEKFEQPTFSLDEQSCRFLLVKRDIARVEATLVLDTTADESAWNVVYLKYNDEVLTDRTV
jgi:hypothetical protein